jgi:hypothetical protein
MIECTIRYGMGQAAQQTRDLSPLLAVTAAAKARFYQLIVLKTFFGLVCVPLSCGWRCSSAGCFPRTTIVVKRLSRFE